LKEEYLTELKLPIWQDPQGNLIIEKCRDNCFVYFNCWSDKWINDEVTWADYIGKITLENSWAIKSMDIEFYDIYTKEDQKHKSSIYIVENSLWLNKMIEKREKHYNNWTKWKDKKYNHYHIKSHDNYFDIIAESYSIEKIKKTDNHYFKRLKNE